MKTADALSIETSLCFTICIRLWFVFAVLDTRTAARHLGANQVVPRLRQIQPGAGGLRHDGRGGGARNPRPRRPRQRAGGGNSRPFERPLRPDETRAVFVVRQFSRPDRRGGRRGGARIRSCAPASGGLRIVQRADGAGAGHAVCEHGLHGNFLSRASFSGPVCKLRCPSSS